jgi:hypothetical protein
MSELRVIESRCGPLIHVVASFTRRRKSSRHVVNGARLLEIPQVTAHALRAQAGVGADGRAFVAIVTGCRGMPAQQRKAIPMILYGSVIDPPALHGMAPFALRAELALVEVRVAIRASRARIGKHLGDVARIAGDGAVHASQRIFRVAIVIEFWIGPQGRPTCGRMAVLACDGDRAMRIARRGLSISQRCHP